MGVRILEENKGTGNKCLYCSTSRTIFGPAFELHEDIESFLGFIGSDARKFHDKELDKKANEWRNKQS